MSHITEPSKEARQLQAVVDRFLTGRNKVKILEAGCGSGTHVYLGRHAYMVGIDISQAQLDRNQIIQEKILGDIQTYVLPEKCFDVVVCWNVLEHLPSPHLALQNFERTLKPGGIMILAVPNPWSLKGLITKFTPHWVHVWYYRLFFGSKTAGKPGYGPYPTMMKFSIAAGSVRKFSDQRNLRIDYWDLYESGQQKRVRRKNGFMNVIFWFLEVLGKCLTFGKWNLNLTDFMVVLRKPGEKSL